MYFHQCCFSEKKIKKKNICLFQWHIFDFHLFLSLILSSYIKELLVFYIADFSLENIESLSLLYGTVYDIFYPCYRPCLDRIMVLTSAMVTQNVLRTHEEK